MLYPPSPTNVAYHKLSPSPMFKKHVGKVISSIILFFIVYIILVVLAIALAIGCFYLGGSIIIAFPRFITLMLGLGMMALGISVVFFLIKFIFAVSKNEDASRVEITEAEQPQLFAFIRKLTEETKAPFPKKIFISNHVNASVFYNSSFWSMFLPVRKNLEIGIGLVNSVNLSEFKAVMAHEFGHFSQRSMKLGSFTYNVNQIIYNMLYENNSYTSFLNSWGTISGYLAIFANITVKIAVLIQNILRQMYKFINKNYFGLSREMEFHADAVAASVSGGNNLVSALGRIELAAACYNSALKNADFLLKENKASKNIFENQLIIFRSFAKDHKLPLKEGLPEISFQFISSFSKSRINYKDQWASHPTLKDRKSHLEKLDIDIEPLETSAWVLFENSGQLQENMTKNLYNAAKIEKPLESVDSQYFEKWLLTEKESTALPTAYNGFYNNRLINIKNWDIDERDNATTAKQFAELFSEQNSQYQAAIDNNLTDINTLKAIHEKQIDVNSFDFDGRKYKPEDCESIIQQLENENLKTTETIEMLDKEAFSFFMTHANTEQAQIKNAFIQYKIWYNKFDDYLKIANAIMEKTNQFYQGNIKIVTVENIVRDIKATDEKKLKDFFRSLIFENTINDTTKNNLKEKITNFNNRDYAYFVTGTFENNELTELRQLTIAVADLLGEKRFGMYKQLLEVQLNIYQQGQHVLSN